MPTDPSSSPALRASDAERDQTIAVLHDAVADGRLDPAEFDERVDAALASRTVDALSSLVTDLIGAPTELLTIKERHGHVRRDGPWRLPHRLALRTAWSAVLLDLTRAVRSGPDLVIEMRVSGGTVELVLAPGMVVDANDLSVRHGALDISSDAGDDTPETLRIHLAGRMRHGSIVTRWQAPPATR
ncbi:DUF1707 domain-containing protein [Nonomuraea sp. K274]|uniref:DUF1707 domain-containing protein n=1 Tax=Nonomuraea cypriaca TaxID=1187855 RepID=A0A931F5Q2_9ACTN|nr:DUF1707 domain-containing protein [Nonomuraea cypriaca]MBF8192306.1 DUF1707 domain-containing protein [Nonomuraea cypriaca]